MSAIAVILAIACCLAVAGGGAIADRPRRQRHGSAVAVRRIGNHEDLGAGLNAILLNVAVALAVVLAVLSTREGSRAAALIIAHPEWLAPVDPQMLPVMSVDDAAGAGAADDPGP